MKKYDALFIFPSSLKDEALDAALDTVGREVEKLGGKTLGTDRMGVRPFARRIKKKDSGCYVRMLLEMDPSAITPFKARLKLNDQVVRVQIVVQDDRARLEKERRVESASESETNHG